MKKLETKIYIAFHGHEDYGTTEVTWDHAVLPSIGETLSINTLFQGMNVPDFARSIRQSVIHRVLWTKVDGETAPILYLRV